MTDREFLSHPERWPKGRIDGLSHCCVKMHSPNGGMPRAFGIIYADEPLRVWVHHKDGNSSIEAKATDYADLETLLKEWWVD